MRKIWGVRALLLAAYCVPYAFLSVYGDGMHGTMLFYGIMAAGLALLCWGALKTKNIAAVYIGNALSFVSSCAAARLSGLEPMGHYFKPFTSDSLIIAISVAAIIVQAIVTLAYKAKNKPGL